MQATFNLLEYKALDLGLDSPLLRRALLGEVPGVGYPDLCIPLTQDIVGHTVGPGILHMLLLLAFQAGCCRCMMQRQSHVPL